MGSHASGAPSPRGRRGAPRVREDGARSRGDVSGQGQFVQHLTPTWGRDGSRRFGRRRRRRLDLGRRR
eukprot:7511505-Pyramimonas_sp.AAC.1